MKEEILIYMIISCFTIAMLFGIIDIIYLTIKIIKEIRK